MVRKCKNRNSKHLRACIAGTAHPCYLNSGCCDKASWPKKLKQHVCPAVLEAGSTVEHSQGGTAEAYRTGLWHTPLPKSYIDLSRTVRAKCRQIPFLVRVLFLPLCHALTGREIKFWCHILPFTRTLIPSWGPHPQKLSRPQSPPQGPTSLYHHIGGQSASISIQGECKHPGHSAY